MPQGVAARGAIWVAAAAVALWGFGRAWPVLWPLLWPFLAGAAFALMVERPVQWMVDHGARRTGAALLSLFGALAVVGLGTLWALAAMWAEVGHLVVHLPALYATCSAVLRRLGDHADSATALLPPGLGATLAGELAKGYAATGPLLQRVVSGAQHAAAQLPDLAFALFVTGATAFFLCRDRPRLAEWFQQRLSASGNRRLRVVLEAVRESVWGIVRTQLLLSLATFLVSLIGLWLIGAPYVLLASLAAAVFDLLPVLGPAMVYVPWIVGAALLHMPGAAMALTAVLAAVATTRWLLTPHLLGTQVGLHPFVALASMYVGARLAGVVGLLLGPVCAALLQAVWLADGRPDALHRPP